MFVAANIQRSDHDDLEFIDHRLCTIEGILVRVHHRSVATVEAENIACAACRND